MKNEKSKTVKLDTNKTFRLPRFTIRILLTLTVFFACLSAYVASEAKRAKRESIVIERLRDFGEVHTYRVPVLSSDGVSRIEASPEKNGFMKWFGALIGENAFHPVTRLEIYRSYNKDANPLPRDDPEFSKLLSELTLLESISLDEFQEPNLQAFANSRRLKSLDISGCDELVDVSQLKNLDQLTTLRLGGCSQLSDIDVIQELAKLESLELSLCPGVKSTKPFENLENLVELDLSVCRELKDLKGIENLSNLETLVLRHCSGLENIDGIEQLSNLRYARLIQCNLSDLSPLSFLQNLTDINLDENELITDLTPLGRLTQLNSINLSACESLTTLDGLQELKQLRYLYLTGCGSLRNVEAVHELKQLKEIAINGCSSLTKKQRENLKAELPNTNVRNFGMF